MDVNWLCLGWSMIKYWAEGLVSTKNHIAVCLSREHAGKCPASQMMSSSSRWQNVCKFLQALWTNQKRQMSLLHWGNTQPRLYKDNCETSVTNTTKSHRTVFPWTLASSATAHTANDIWVGAITEPIWETKPKPWWPHPKAWYSWILSSSAVFVIYVWGQRKRKKTWGKRSKTTRGRYKRL